MALLMDRRTMGLTHMGGEGAQWVGMAPFTETPHIFQNLGDGTFFHSGSLAIRQAVAAGTNVTYKILYNSAVAMTGGQDAAGAMPVADLTRMLEAEGAKRIVVITDEPEKYGKGARWASGVEVWHRDRLDEAQRLRRGIPGVTVLLYDQRCAAEKRRLRKRKKLPDPALRVFINEAVCEGCGDCGVKSNCLSVQPVETEFGRKTQIHQSSCNKDYSCLDGDCPSILTDDREVSNKVAAGGADCYLGFDLLVATSATNLDHARGDKTIAVISTSQVPTGAMVTQTDVHFPELAALTTSLSRVTRKDENVYLDALGLAETLFDDHMAANLIVLGAAYQGGAVPVAAQAIERAIALNGVSVEMNTQAFRAGRLAVVNPELVAARKVRRVGAAEVEPALHLHPEARALVDSAGADGELRRLLAIRVPELI